MNQRNEITYRKLPGLSTQGLRIWGLIFLAFGIAYNPAMEALFHSEEQDFLFTTMGLIFQLLHYCAIPIFAFLLVEGITHTISIKQYATRIAILALITELPFNLAMNGSLLGALSFKDGFHFDFKAFSLNPVFGLLLAIVLLHFFRRYSGKSFKRIAIKGMLWVMAFVWTQMLHIQYAVAVVLLVPIMYFLRGKRMLLIFAGCVAMTLCGFLEQMLEASWLINRATEQTGLAFTSTASYIASAPVSFVLIHFYNGERGEGNRYVNYLAYPVILIVIGLVAQFAIR